MARPCVLGASALPEFLQSPLEKDFEFHDRLHKKDPAAFAEIAPRIRGLIVGGGSPVTKELLDQLPALEVISVFAVGYDKVDVAAAKARGIPVSHTPDVLTDDVADLSMALMFNIARQLPAADRFVRDGNWAQGAFPLQRKVSGARLGIMGLGRIGRAIAKRGEALGMHVGYHSRTRKFDVDYTFHDSLNELATASDFLVIAAYGGPSTEGLVDESVLEALGKKGYLINIARGSIIDEPALLDALEQGRIAGAGLDVFATEPGINERFLSLPNVVLAPHVGSATWQTRQAMAQLAHANLEAHFAGGKLLTPVPES
ncbi:2-hydroxyacid dehydrogenase [Pokkaliibacter sp. CJK22405]|uniref:2-hydroxyacid dehydrogenase n=1 Tax=Pokkaliibacter sp. CJK22405 TaxID=3384615 RepID=UPI003984FA5E